MDHITILSSNVHLTDGKILSPSASAHLSHQVVQKVDSIGIGLLKVIFG